MNFGSSSPVHLLLLSASRWRGFVMWLRRWMQECNFETQDWDGGSSCLLDLGDYFFPLLSFWISLSEVPNLIKMLTKVNCLHHCSLIWQISSRGLKSTSACEWMVSWCQQSQKERLVWCSWLCWSRIPALFGRHSEGLTVSHSFCAAQQQGKLQCLQ